MEILDTLLKDGDLNVCLKDRNHRVLFQNKPCRKLCGDKSSQICEENCMELYRQDPDSPDREEGTQYFPNKQVNDQYFDIILLNDGQYLISLLYPLKDKHQADLKYFSKWNLTRREKEIVGLVIKGNTNDQITKQLFISRGTLKNHLNNIYKKLPSHVIAPWRQSNKVS
jgi:DNA-binding CsgD family transcriptional regulator